MQTIQIDGLKFDGPYVLGRDELPNVPAIALIITEAGEGFKIMSVLHGVNIKEEIEKLILGFADGPMPRTVSHLNWLLNIVHMDEDAINEITI